MRLYLIKRKSDRKFFVSINGHVALCSKSDPEYWSSKPSMFLKTPEGVAGNLRKLCSEPFWSYDVPDGVCETVASGWCELAWRNFDETKLSQYEIVAMDIDVLSMSATPATEFVQVEVIAKQPLTKSERAA